MTGFEKSSFHVVMYPVERATWQRTEGKLWLIAIKKLSLPASEQQNGAKNREILEADPSLCRPQMRLQPHDMLIEAFVGF